MSQATTTPTYASTLLTPDRRRTVAADPGIGGGNLLPSALSVNPDPTTAFLHSVRPVADAAGEPRHDFSLVQLDELAQSWSAWYLARGVGPRDRVAVWFTDSFAYSVHFWALAQIGAIAVLVNSNAPEEVALSLIDQTDPVGVYLDRERLARIGGELPAGLRFAQLAEELPGPPRAVLPDTARFRHVDDDPVVVLHSSGTTGRPKPTIHTHRTIVSGPKFRLVDHTEPAGGLMMTGLPQSHLGCIAYTVYAVLAGSPTVAAFDRSGADLAAAVAQYRPTSVMSFAHGYSELAAADPPAGALDSVNAWISIGDAVHEAHIKKILGWRSPGLPPAAFLDRLGTTELGWGVLLESRTLETERNDRCAGRPVGVAEVAILRQDGTLAGDNEVGLLAARGPAITPGYWNNADITYRSRLGGFWLTGDNAYRDEHGDHYLVDRTVDAIQTADGVGYSVFMEEVLLSDVPDVVDCAVVAGCDGGTVHPVAVVTTSSATPEPARLLRTANEALSAAGHPPLAVLEIVADDGIPVGVTGKVLKRRLRERYADLRAHLAVATGPIAAVI
jgi:acyl-coenzyme A synthetase/AMP-(fatty) acid ligase